MKVIFNFTYIICMSLIILLATNNSFADVGFLLIVLVINLISYKIEHRKWMTTVEMIVVILATYQNPIFSYFFGMIIYKLILEKNYIAVMPVLLAIFTLSEHIALEILVTTMLLCGYFAYYISVATDKALSLEKKHDDERALRFSIENEMSMMFDSFDKVEQLAKLSERSRIAMNIHDNVGHSIAGVLMQLQAAKKIENIDKNKSKELYGEATKKLAGTLEMLREIVHDLKPAKSIGVESIKKIVNGFKFCDIEATYTGDFTSISAVHLEVITAIVKEALTNIIKHSRASAVKFALESNKKFLRLYIKDNGIGCDKITENLGIRSMKTRAQNIGGSFSIGNDNGIVIVCMLIHVSKEGGVSFAYTNS
ncbi:MAG: sensor histidine kinase [Alkaliphilus sp.]